MKRYDDLHDFFGRYASTSLGPGPEKLAGFYDESFLVAGPKGAGAFRNDAAFVEWLRQVHEFNARTGLISMTPEGVEQHRVSAEYLLVTVHWAARFQRTGDVPIRFDITYLLRESESGFKIAAYISHEDQEDVMRAHGLL